MIASMIPPLKRVIDVGCDHAYLDIYLTIHGKNHCIASDVSPHVLEKTRSMISSYHLENQIEVVLSDGLEEIDVCSDDVVVLAGMGTSTIIHILEKKRTDHMILSSHNDLDKLRLFIEQNGYFIDQEEVVFEKGIYYVVMSVKKGTVCYSFQERLFGPFLIHKKDDVTVSYFHYLLKKKEAIFSKVPVDRRFHLSKEIDCLKEILKSDV